MPAHLEVSEHGPSAWSSSALAYESCSKAASPSLLVASALLSAAALPSESEVSSFLTLGLTISAVSAVCRGLERRVKIWAHLKSQSTERLDAEEKDEEAVTNLASPVPDELVVLVEEFDNLVGAIVDGASYDAAAGEGRFVSVSSHHICKGRGRTYVVHSAISRSSCRTAVVVPSLLVIL